MTFDRVQEDKKLLHGFGFEDKVEIRMCYKLPFRGENGNPLTSSPRAFPNLVPRSPTAKGKGPNSLFIVKQSEIWVRD